jgi:beta-glucanase (GH16 family)
MAVERSRRPSTPHFANQTRKTMRLISCFSLALLSAAAARAAAPLSLLDAQVANSSAQVSHARGADGLTVTIQPGDEGYPGVALTPQSGAAWDLSAYGHIAAAVRNLGEKPVTVCLRIDDDGDWKANPWNAENLYLKPGATGVVDVIFGYTFGHKPGYRLKPAAVTKLLLFAGKSKDAPQAFRVESLAAAGPAGEKPPVDPQSIRIVPPNGVLLSAAEGVEMRAETRDLSAAWSGPKTNGTLRLALAAGKASGRASLKPPAGRWNLRAGTAFEAELLNSGAAALTAEISLANDGSAAGAASVALAPGERRRLAIPFASTNLWNGSDEKHTGSRFASDRANVVTLALARGGEGEAALTVERLAVAAKPLPVPAWLGKRPPVAGDWNLTFSDEFAGDAVDTNKWSFYGENYWDKVTHFSKETTTVKDGHAHLKLMKKRGRHNDDPKRNESDYATGFLESYGKFTQRYGYFEARMKLPTAPGLWPAFWMMPDRGGGGPQWQRSDTKSGGMEFDIMEHLTRWGVNRFNIALHWDGYSKEHKSIGSASVYYTPDADGYVTSGLLWTPGEAVFYCQGQEIGRWKNERVSSVPEHIMFTLPAGGWDNDWLDDARLPDEFLIDYVRVWQRADLAQ